MAQILGGFVLFFAVAGLSRVNEEALKIKPAEAIT